MNRTIRVGWALLGLASCLAFFCPWVFVATGGPALAFAVLAGSRATAATQGIESNSRVIDMSDTIHLLDPNQAPLTAITMRLRKARCINPKVEWLEDDYLPSATQVNGTQSATTTTGITVDDASFISAGDILINVSSGETLLVGARVSSTTFAATRSWGATAAAALNDNDILIQIGSASAEGATSREMLTTTKTPKYNYTQIFRNSFGATGTLMASELYGGDDLSFQTRKKGIEHRMQIERAFLFGERNEDTTGATPVRTCDGILEVITTNITDANQTLSAAEMEDFLRAGMRYGNNGRKLLFASRTVLSVLNQIASANIRTFPTTESFPLRLKVYDSAHGDVYLIAHHQLITPFSSTANDRAYEGWAVLLDLDSIYYRYLVANGNSRDTKLKTNIQANDEDGRKDEYLSECCPMLIQEKNHSVLKDVANA